MVTQEEREKEMEEWRKYQEEYERKRAEHERRVGEWERSGGERKQGGREPVESRVSNQAPLLVGAPSGSRSGLEDGLTKSFARGHKVSGAGRGGFAGRLGKSLFSSGLETANRQEGEATGDNFLGGRGGSSLPPSRIPIATSRLRRNKQPLAVPAASTVRSERRVRTRLEVLPGGSPNRPSTLLPGGSLAAGLSNDESMPMAAPPRSVWHLSPGPTLANPDNLWSSSRVHLAGSAPTTTPPTTLMRRVVRKEGKVSAESLKWRSASSSPPTPPVPPLPADLLSRFPPGGFSSSSASASASAFAAATAATTAAAASSSNNNTITTITTTTTMPTKVAVIARGDDDTTRLVVRKTRSAFGAGPSGPIVGKPEVPRVVTPPPVITEGESFWIHTPSPSPTKMRKVAAMAAKSFGTIRGKLSRTNLRDDSGRTRVASADSNGSGGTSGGGLRGFLSRSSQGTTIANQSLLAPSALVASGDGVFGSAVVPALDPFSSVPLSSSPPFAAPAGRGRLFSAASVSSSSAPLRLPPPRLVSSGAAAAAAAPTTTATITTITTTPHPPPRPPRPSAAEVAAAFAAVAAPTTREQDQLQALGQPSPLAAAAAATTVAAPVWAPSLPAPSLPPPLPPLPARPVSPERPALKKKKSLAQFLFGRRKEKGKGKGKEKEKQTEDDDDDDKSGPSSAVAAAPLPVAAAAGPTGRPYRLDVPGGWI